MVDLHAHYPMHLLPPARKGLTPARWRALLIQLASRFGNWRSAFSGPRVTMGSLRDGEVKAILSVLYSFFDEFDVDLDGGTPEAGYLERLIGQLELTEADVAGHADEAAIARTPTELDAIVESGRVAIVHCVEGGFHLGPTPDHVERAVAELAGRGVAYITLAHLVWRGVATNAPAIPFLPDPVYRRLFPQPDEGLSELGRAAVRAMVDHGVLIDVSHMSRRALDDTFGLLDEHDPGRRTRVLASHAAYGFGDQEYGISEATVERIAARRGVIGLILAQHQLNDGVLPPRRRTRTLAQSLDVIDRHVERIRAITGSDEHVAIGSDFDGFIKPTMGGLESMADMRALASGLSERHGPEVAARIVSENALELLREGWRGATGRDDR
jgi:microsomal dipeptidase-like Zn-dependent dipeptidase